MRNLAVLIVCLLISCLSFAGGSVVMGTTQTNPAANTVLVTSGALTSGGSSGGWYRIGFACNGTLLFTCQIQLYDGSTVQSYFNMSIPVNDMRFWSSGDISTYIPDGWSIRVVNPSLIVLGAVQANVIYEVVAVN